MCMTGQLQWAITIGRYDIQALVMSMSRFRLAPKIKHFVKNMLWHIAKETYSVRYTSNCTV